MFARTWAASSQRPFTSPPRAIVRVGGQSVSSAGDVDGDGLDDLLVGASGNGDGDPAAGKAYLILGASLGTTSEIDLSDADYSFVGEVASDLAGFFVSSAGDVDGVFRGGRTRDVGRA